MEKIKENNTNDPGTRSSIDNQSALKNNEVYQAISDIKDFYNDILSIISKDEDPDTPRFIIQNGVINRVQQDPRGYFEYLAYNMLRSEDALIKQIIYRYCIDNNRKDGINNLIHSDSDAPSTTNEVAIYDLSHLLQSWYATILNDCNGELQELSQPNIMNEFDICTNNKNKIDIDDADSSNKSPTSSLFIRRTGTNLSVQIKNNNKTPPLIDSSLSVLKSGSHSLEASPMVMSGEIGDLGSARKELDSRGHVWLDAKPASGLASIQAADKVGDNALRDRSNSKSYVYTNSSPDSSPDSYKSGTTYSSNVEKVTKSFGDGMELDSNSNNSDVESISTVPSTDVATDTVSNNITESKESVSSAVPMEPKLLISPFSNYCYQTFNFLPDVIRKQLNDSEEETRAEGQTGRTTATVPQKSETEVPSLTRSTESSMYNILANLSRSNSGKKSNGTFIDEDCDLGLGMEFDGSLVINEHIFDIGSLRQVEEGNDDHIDPRDDTVDGVSPRRKPGTLAHSSLADYYNSASKEKQQIRRGQENMFFSGDDGHVPTDLIPMDSNSLTIITDEPVVKKSGIKESDSVNKHTPVPTANSSSVVTPSISPAPSVQRRKRRKYMEISEMNKNGIMINKQIVAPKGIYRTPHGFRVQLNIENMKNITGNSNVMKGKFSRNSKTFEDAVWIYEIAILMSDMPHDVNDMIAHGNYESMFSMNWIYTYQDYLNALLEHINSLHAAKMLTGIEYGIAQQAYEKLNIGSLALGETYLNSGLPPPPDAAGNSSVSEPNNNNLAVSGIVCKKSNKRLDANIKHNSNSASIVMDSTVGDDVIDHISTIDVSGSTYDGQLAFDESEFGSDVL